MAVNLLKKSEKQTEFFAIEKIGIVYNIISTLLVVILYSRLGHPDTMLCEHFAIIVGMFILVFVYDRYPCNLTLFLRIVFQMALLSYWYPETYEFNRLFPNLDHLFADAEFTVFGFQPAGLFAQELPSFWASEAFNMGYFSYYPMILAVVLFYFIKFTDRTDRVTFIIMASFFLYYLIYIFVPVAGPQFYFPLLEPAQITDGCYPALNDYFYHHPELLPGASSQGGLFGSLVEMSQAAGERPTAAFPSSHVGISTIVMILAYKGKKLFFFILLPFYLLLCGATVYIQAHYLIDVFAGWATAILFYCICSYGYDRWLSSSRLFKQ